MNKRRRREEKSFHRNNVSAGRKGRKKKKKDGGIFNPTGEELKRIRKLSECFNGRAEKRANLAS